MDRYGSPDQPMTFRGFQPSNVDFERVRTGIDARIFTLSHTVVGVGAGSIVFDVSGDFLVFDGATTINAGTGGGSATVELNPANDVGGALLTISRGMAIRAPFRQLKFTWPAGSSGKIIKAHYGVGASLDLNIDVADVSITNALLMSTLQPGSTELGLVSAQTTAPIAPVTAFDGARGGTGMVNYQNATLIGANTNLQIIAAGTYANEFYLVDCFAQCLIASNANRLLLCGGTTAPTSATSNPVLAIGEPIILHAGPAYTFRLRTRGPMSLNPAWGLWVRNDGATAQTAFECFAHHGGA